MLTTLRALPVFLIVTATTVSAAPEKAVDPSTIQDKVTITVGKKLNVQLTQKGDALSAPEIVEKPDDKTATVTFDFLNQAGMLILATKNPYPKDLKFRALARHKGRKDYFETSIVPVKAKLLSFELWQEPIEELVLFDFKLINETP